MAIILNAKTSGVGGLETSADNSGDINIQSGGSTVMSVTSSGVAVTGSFSQNGAVYSTQPSFRNLIINGDMRIAQRGTSTSGITAGGTYPSIDRMRYALSTIGTWTHAQDTDVPTGQGFAFSNKLSCTTSTTLSAGSFILWQQIIEGQNLQSLKKGTSNAEPLTASFWVKTNKTGIFTVELYDTDNTRSISQLVTINAANTWEKKTITFPGDTTGTIVSDNSSGMTMHLWLAAGSNFTSGTLATSWEASTAANRAVGQTINLADSTSNYINITGVQLEVGSTATEFEHLPVDVELARCERYFEISYNQGTALGTVTQDGAEMWLANRNPGAPHHYLKFRTVKRTIPGVTIYNPSTGATGSFRNLDAGTNPSSVTSRIGHKGTTLYTGTSTGLGQFMQFHYTADAEL